MVSGLDTCSTRSTEEIDHASSSSVVFTPFVRRSGLTSNTFFAAAEFAGVLNDGVALPDVAKCVLATPEHDGKESTFNAIRSVDKNVIPSAAECHGADNKAIHTLKDVKGNVFIIGHGNGRHPRFEIGFGAGGNTEHESFSPDELADLLVQNGLSCEHAKITLVFVRGGMSISKSASSQRYVELYRRMHAARSNDDITEATEEWGDLALQVRDPLTFEAVFDASSQETPFITLLGLALRERGYMNVEVAGFRGEIDNRLLKSAPNAGPYAGLQVYATPRLLAFQGCKIIKDHHAREKCVQRLVSPCEECMIENPKGPFLARINKCRTKLAKGNKAQKNSSTICMVESVPASEEWTFSISTDSLDLD